MDKSEFQRTVTLKDEYIHDLYDDENGDFIGATNVKILGFADDMDMFIGYPWGEVGRFHMTEKRLNEGSLPAICELYDYDLHEFELLVGKMIRVRIREIGSGYNESKCNINYNEEKLFRPIDTVNRINQYPEVGDYSDKEPFQIEIGNIWSLMGKAMVIVAFIVVFCILFF